MNGYFDFEDKAHGIHSNNRSTTTDPLLAKMNGLNWQKEASDKNCGIIPEFFFRKTERADFKSFIK